MSVVSFLGKKEDTAERTIAARSQVGVVERSSEAASLHKPWQYIPSFFPAIFVSSDSTEL